MVDEWKITSKWTNKMNDVIHNHLDSTLCVRYPDLQIINEHMFYLAPDVGDQNTIRIYIGVTDENTDDRLNLELFGGYGIVAIPNSIYREMYYNPSVMSNFELALGDVLDNVVKRSRFWSGDCGIVHELKTYITMHNSAVKE